MANNILKIYKSKQTIFTAKDIALIWEESNFNNLKSKIKYYVDKKNIIKLRKGIYAKENYNKLELATKIYTPAYLSFETVLQNEGVIFQPYESLFVASYLSREIKCNNKQKIIYRKLKKEILFNEQGIIKKQNYFMASQERAFLDTVYLFKNYYFDNLKNINWEKCFDLVKIYKNKKMIKYLNSYYQENV